MLVSIYSSEAKMSKHLIIKCVESEYTHEFMANVFWKLDIAKVKSITLIPYVKNNNVFHHAYITIESWCETEASYNFVKRLNDTNKEARLVYLDDNWWVVEHSPNDFEFQAGNYTTTFANHYYEKGLNLDADLESDSDTEDYAPICGIYGEHYTVQGAKNRLRDVNVEWGDAILVGDESQVQLCEYEMKHLEIELQLHNAVNNSVHVTTRWAPVYPEVGCRREINA